MDAKRFPVLHTFMSVPGIKKHIIIRNEATAEDPYAMEVTIDYMLPEKDMNDYKLGLHNFIMNYISKKVLTEEEIKIFEQLANDMAVSSGTLEDIENLIDKI